MLNTDRRCWPEETTGQGLISKGKQVAQNVLNKKVLQQLDPDQYLGDELMEFYPDLTVEDHAWRYSSMRKYIIPFFCG